MPKMNDLEVLETSGVDHPAHLHEGFAVMKAKDPEKASSIMRALGKDKNMGTNPRTPAPPAGSADAIAKAVAEAVKKDLGGDLKAVQDELAQVWQKLQTVVQSTDEQTPTAEETAATAAPAAAPAAVAAAAELEKALEKADPAVAAILRKQAADLAAVNKAAEDARAEANAAIEKARAEEGKRLDADAIAKSRTEFSNLAIDHEAIAPALRALGDSPLAKSLRATLTSLNEQQDGADIFKELGVSGSTAVTKGVEAVRKRAQDLVDAGTFDSIAKAEAHIYTTDPAAVEAARTKEA